ncbi:hypothetical protein [Vibrio taketomensis]|uniref:hypothetical protein n=1 Tax=Vibrio taketomensis TaxID=2572923 RepID=UPI001E3D5BB7|nr:hypothetical protein [Vibrio taketomensis]
MISINFASNETHLYTPLLNWLAIMVMHRNQSLSVWFRLVGCHLAYLRSVSTLESYNFLSVGLFQFNTLEDWRTPLYINTYRHGDFSRHMTRSFLDVRNKTYA